MKKRVLSLILVVVMLFTLVITALAAPKGGAVVWTMTSATLKADTLKDGDTTTVDLSLSIDPEAYAIMDATNLTLNYDNKLISLSDSSSGYKSSDPSYDMDPSAKTDSQINLMINNIGTKESGGVSSVPDADGFCVKVTITVTIVDAAALIKAGSTVIKLGYFNNDFNTRDFDGKYIEYQTVGDSVMPTTFSDATITVDGGSVTPPAAETWSITFNTNGGSAVDTSKVEKGQSIKLPTTTKDGYTFDGWYTDSGLKTKADDPFTPGADTTLYAKWTENTVPPTDETWKVTYNTNGGNAIDSANVKKGESVTLPTPTKSGYTFAGWYSEASLSNKVRSPFTPTADITLYAKWTEKAVTPTDETWKVTYNTNGGNTINPANVKKGESVTLPTPTKSGYTFAGWYSDANLSNKVSSPFTPGANTTLYAKWAENTVTPTDDTWKVTYNTNGGNTINPVNVKKGESVTMPTPTKSGYTFAGWYTDEGLSTKVTGTTYNPTADTTLYAKWTVSNGAGAAGGGTTGATSVPKTGASNSIIVLLSAMGVLVLGAGSVIAVRYRKIKKD